MKNKITVFLLTLIFCYPALAQTNTFPATGNVGIGTISPGTLLTVVGSANFTGTAGSSIGLNAGYIINYNSNIFLHTTGGGLSGSNESVYLGEFAGDNVVATNNFHNGSVGIGYNALLNLGLDNFRGNHNTAVGWRSLMNLNGETGVQADKNTMVGSRSGEWLSSGRENTGVGYNVFYNSRASITEASIEGVGNTAIGGAVNVIEDAATVSFGLLGLVDDGSYNTVVGYGSGTRVTTGDNNLIIGDNSGSSATAGVGITTGSNNIVIGSGINVQSGTTNNQLNIGNLIYGNTTANVLSIGNNDIIGLTSMFNVGASNQFQVNLNGRINNYNGIGTVNNGVASQVAVVNLANQSATIPASTVLYTSAAEGFYRISYMGVITAAASYSSGAPASSSLSLRVKYNDPNLASDVVVPPTNLDPVNSYSSNAVGGNFSGSMLVYVEAGSNITYKATYASDPPAPATVPDANMVYSLRIVVEKL